MDDASGRWRRLAAFVLGLALAGVGQYYCGRRQAFPATVWYVAAALVTVLSLIGSESPAAPGGQARRTHLAGRSAIGTVLAVLAIVAAAYPALYWRNTDMPPGPAHDEASFWLEALAFFTGKVKAWWAPGIGGAPDIYGAFNGFLFHYFPPTLGTFRASNATWTLLAAVVLFLYVRQFGGTLIGAVTAILFTHCVWVAHMSRWGFSIPWSMFGGILAYAAIGWGLMTIDRARALRPSHPLRWGPYALAGFGAMFAQYGYISGRFILPALAVTVLLACAFRFRRLADARPALAALAGASLLVALPWIWALRLKPDLVFARAKGLSIQIDIRKANSLRPLWQNLVAHLSLFNYRGDGSPQNNIPDHPLLLPLVAPVVAMGLAVALYRWRDVVQAMPLLWFGILIWSGVLSRLIEAPKAHRIFTTAPVLFVALGGWLSEARRLLDAALETTGRWVRRAVRATGALVLTCWVGADAYVAYRLYFVEYYRQAGLYYTFSPREMLLDRSLRSSAGVPTVLAFKEYPEALKALTYFYTWVKFVPVGRESLYDVLPAGGPLRLYVDPSYCESLRRLAAECSTEMATVKDPRSTDIWWVQAALPDASCARDVLGRQPLLFATGAAVAPLPRSPGGSW